MKILKKVDVKEKLPNNKGEYFCINKGGYKFICYFDTYFYYLDEDYTDQIEYWYEPIEIKLKSEEIFDNSVVDKLVELSLVYTFSRNYLIDLCKIYHKALEAAENEIIKLKNDYKKLKII